jgi:sialidase-1
MSRENNTVPRLYKVIVAAALWAAAALTPFDALAGDANPFWADGTAVLEVQELTKGQRFPCVVVAMDGSVLAFRCSNNPITLRRSEDGGATWGPEIVVSKESYKALGSAVVDENTGDVMLFADYLKPMFVMYRSRDHGKTWSSEKVKKIPDGFGGVPSTHGAEHGITLRYGKKKGRLLIPARVFGPKNSNAQEWRHYCYNSAMYSDDGGKTWQTSGPFPELGTGEGTLAELSNGDIFYNSRNHMMPNTKRRSAWSYDGGEIWTNLRIIDQLPDGPRDHPYGCKSGLVRLPLEKHDILITSNLDSPSGRRRGTIWASFDGGKTWPIKRLVFEGPFAYSSLAAGRPGTPSEGMIYLLFEGGKKGKYDGIHVARFNLPWVTEGKDWKEFLKE